MSLQPLTRSDRRALLPLLLFAVALVATLWFLSTHSDKHPEQTYIPTDTADSTAHATAQATTPHDNTESQQPQMKPFDPNTVDSATLVGFGLRPYQAHAFIRYRAAGAIFRQPLDIARINSLDDDDIDRLLPYIHIAQQYQNRRTKYPIGAHYDNPDQPTAHPTAPTTTQPHYTSNKFTTLTPVDPNTADTTLLMRIPGIGTNIATWIVRHRERLGGFHSLSQLLEVKHVSTDMLQWFELQTDSLRRININTATFLTLSSHPYIGYSRAKALSNRIRLHGPFADADDIRATTLFADDTLSLLLPYLDF